MTNPQPTDTSRSGDLVERLREKIVDTLLAGLPYNRDGYEAADRIEALEAENERLREAVVGLMEIAEMAMPDTYFATDTRVNAARAALGKK